VLGAGAGAVLGFLPFNLSPASIIMGDTGSILLGFLVAAVGITITQSGSSAAAPWVPIIVLAVPLLDTAWAVTRRAIARSPIFAPDRKHVHHRLLAAGLSQRNAMLLLWAASASFGLVGVLIAR
jgi:UDP-GlcNAc:undecaprenyl-phosphate GlcNAc-1-phosphate transferase